MTTTFDPKKPIKTTSGLSARIVCTDVQHPSYPIAAAIMSDEGQETVETFTAEGKYFDDDQDNYLDLVNAPVTRYGYLPLPDKANTYAYVDIYPNLDNGHPFIEITFEDDKPVDVRILPKCSDQELEI